MAAVTPSTDLYLLQCPIEIDNRNQINFANATAQYNYFSGLNKLSVDNFSYQRKDSTIRYPAHIDDIRHYNYVMYRNDNYSNKWFYAFIENMEYLNDSTTLIKIKTDCYQTWQFDIIFKRSFVVREHVNDDTIGKHTLEEDLPVGEPIINNQQVMNICSILDGNVRYVCQVTQLPDGVNIPSPQNGNTYDDRIYNGVPQGCYICVFKNTKQFSKFSTWYDKKGQQGALVAYFIVPESLVGNTYYKTYTIGESVGDVEVGFMASSNNYVNITTPNITYSSTLDGYTPVNRKLYCYPYSYLAVSNNAGANIVYHYEDWQDPTNPWWLCAGIMSQGCQIRLYPNAYKRYALTSGWDYGINSGKLPILSWQSDFYLNWQAQNGANQNVQTVSNLANDVGNIVGAVGTMLSGNIVSGVGRLIGTGGDIASDISGAIHERHVAELVPMQAKGNVNCGDLGYSTRRLGFTFLKMSCRAEYARMIDSYFSMFGYKINEVKIPNITGRQNWNYVKCIQSNIIGNVPQEDIEEIKQIFNDGVTIWHNPATFMDYSQNNPIV